VGFHLDERRQQFVEAGTIRGEGAEKAALRAGLCDIDDVRGMHVAHESCSLIAICAVRSINVDNAQRTITDHVSPAAALPATAAATKKLRVNTYLVASFTTGCCTIASTTPYYYAAEHLSRFFFAAMS